MWGAVRVSLSVCLVLTVQPSESMCPPDACHYIDCVPAEALNCAHGVQPNGGVCGCCDGCIVLLGEGDICLAPPGAPEGVLRCNPDYLYCDTTSHFCRKKTCAMRYQELQARMNSTAGQFIVGLTLPNCAEDGAYAPIQCSGSVCYCTDRAGNRLYNDDQLPYEANRWESHDMDCQCAIDELLYRESGQSGGRPACSTNGSY